MVFSECMVSTSTDTCLVSGDMVVGMLMVLATPRGLCNICLPVGLF